MGRLAGLGYCFTCKKPLASGKSYRMRCKRCYDNYLKRDNWIVNHFVEQTIKEMEFWLRIRKMNEEETGITFPPFSFNSEEDEEKVLTGQFNGRKIN